ncbi:MAG: FemAB family XrtA/PEP-CTERM system-associated protein [Alphaproteobacteria bacterium]
MTAIELRTDVDGAAWDAFVAARPAGTFYQRFGWSRVIAETFGHRPRYLAALRGGSIAGVLPLTEVRSRLFGNALISTAFCVGGGPLADDADVLRALVERARALGAELGVDYIELRDAPPLENWVARAGVYAGFERGIAADEAECLKQIPRKQRAVVRKALENAELSFTLDDDASHFYRLHARTFRNHGTPVYPRRLFDKILEVFGRDCDVLTVWRGKEPVSSVMSYYVGARVTPYFTGSVAVARALGSNDLMYWRLMRHAVGRGCTSFDFGRSKVGSGPFAFKKNWGFEPRAITNYLALVNGRALPNVSPTNPKFSLAIKAWRAMPVPVATFVSLFISRDLA